MLHITEQRLFYEQPKDDAIPNPSLMKTQADRIRWNMGQMPERYFDLDYVRRCVASLDGLIRAETHNQRNAPFLRAPLQLRFDEKLRYECELHDAEHLLSEIEHTYRFGYFGFQQAD